MTDKTLKVCDGCQADLEAVGYTVVRFPAMLPTIGRCDFCKKRKPIYTAAVGKTTVDKHCGEMVQSSAVTVLQHENQSLNLA